MKPLAINRTSIASLAVGEVAECSVFSSLPELGNPTTVIRFPAWPSVMRLQQLARSSGVVETTFVVAQDGELELRWFAGDYEVPLCGHGALAASAMLAGMFTADELYAVRNLPGRLWLGHAAGQALVAFPPGRVTQLPVDEVDFGTRPVRVFDAGRDYLVVLENEAQLIAYRPDSTILGTLDKIGCIMTAPCSNGTAAFRFFAPRAGIPEDKASGSVIPALVGYWGSSGQQEFEFLQHSGWDIRIAARCLAGRIVVTGNVFELSRSPLAAAAND